MDSAELVTIPEAQRRTHLGRRQFNSAIRQGLLSVYDIGGWPRVRWSDCLAWIESKRRAPRDRMAEEHNAPEMGR